MKNLVTIFFLIQIFTSGASPSNSDLVNSKENGDKLIPVTSAPNLFKWTDACNVYVLRDGDKALLIDLGDGSVLNHLSDIGVKEIEWVLFTHHHREQSQGYQLLSSWNPKIAVPRAEKMFFEQPSSFRKSAPSNGDPYSVHGASYLRPPIQPILIDHEFSRMDSFTWRGHEFWCMETPGNSPGSMTYLLKSNEVWVAFSGDVMMDGAKMHNFFDSEWDYGFGAGFRALHNSAALLRDFQPSILLPSHGNLIMDPTTQLETYIKKIFNLERLISRGYDHLSYTTSFQDMVSKPTDIPYLWQISKHLFKFKGPNLFANFSLIMSDDGHALLVDCGLIDSTFLEKTLESMKAKYGLKQIDALIVTHIHGDHFLNAPYLKRKWGTPVWVLDIMVPIMEQPERYDLPAMMRGYNSGFDTIHVDRAFKPGDTFHWEEIDFTLDWMPGQTKYALCMHGIIDKRKVAFTGDNIFGNPVDSKHTGHEAVVARNDAILEEGYMHAAEYLIRLKPDILIGGHSFVMNKPAELIKRYRNWAYEIREAFQAVSNETDYRFWFDPYWVRADPYRTAIKKGDTVEIDIVVRNFSKDKNTYRIELNTPSGIIADPAYLEVSVNKESSETFPVKFTTPKNSTSGNFIVAFDVTKNGKRYGEWFDAIIEIIE